MAEYSDKVTEKRPQPLVPTVSIWMKELTGEPIKSSDETSILLLSQSVFYLSSAACLWSLCSSHFTDGWSSSRLKLSPSPSSRVTVSRTTGSSCRSSKRKRVETTKDMLAEDATASGAITISPTDMDGNAVTLANDTEQVHTAVGRAVRLGCRNTVGPPDTSFTKHDYFMLRVCNYTILLLIRGNI